MRTTIDLDPGVLRDLKARARRDGKSLGRVASELLAAGLDADAPGAPEPFTWEVRRMDARVDLEDKEAVRRLIDQT